MKTTLNALLLVLAIALPAITFAGLVGILPLAAFAASEAALLAFALVGLFLIALTDDGHGIRPVIVRRSAPALRSALTAKPAPFGPSYGLRRPVCTTA